MKKIGILTFHNAYNFGAVLQAYALKEYLQKNSNCTVEIVNYKNEQIEKEKSRWKSLFNNNVIKELARNLLTTPYYLKLDKVFSKFVNKYLTADNEIKKEDLSSLKYDLYFYGDTVARHKENRQIRKIFYLVVRANSIFFIWNIALGILKRDSIVTYVRKIFTGKSILKFLVLNESPLAGHLWYLGAILYVLVIVLLVDRFNCKKVLYYLTPVLLIADLVFGKYSLLIFHREFPYILVRNFLCVGIPYFCIGNLIREKRCSEKWNRKILQVLIVVFTITSLAERFVLVSAGLNATRDHYLSTTFLAICLFVYTLKSNWHNKGLAVIGRKCSTWLYIIHPIFITAFSVATGKLGIKSIYRCVAPIVTYCATLTFLIVMCRLKSLLVKNNQRK